MLALAGGQLVEGRVMAGSAENRSGIRTVSQSERLMCLVARGAIGLHHGLGVRRMACHAVGNVTMGISMAEVAGNFGMHARTDDHLLAGAGVASLANSLDFAFKLDIQRLMRVVAAHASGNFIVTGSRVAVAALRYVVRNLGTVPFVTGLAINLGFVRRTIRFDLSRLLIMAFDAVGRRQYRLLRLGTSDAPPRKTSRTQQHQSKFFR